MTTIDITLPIRTVSEANMREHWGAKAARARQQRETVKLGLYNLRALRPPHECHVVVKLTRHAHKVMDGDNLQRSLKAVRDEVAAFIGLDDGSRWLEWDYAQTKGEYAVNIRIEWGG